MFPGTAEDLPPRDAHIHLHRNETNITDEPKLEEFEDYATPGPDVSMFRFHKEDHTLGNLLPQRLLKYKYTQFSAYKIDSIFHNLDLRVQTGGLMSPREAVVRCCKDVNQDLDTLKKSFVVEYLGHRMITEYEQGRDAAAATEQSTTVTAKEAQETRWRRQWYWHGHRLAR
jgi:DNA-directed RNA polymerase II subunit RPB11